MAPSGKMPQNLAATRYCLYGVHVVVSTAVVTELFPQTSRTEQRLPPVPSGPASDLPVQRRSSLQKDSLQEPPPVPGALFFSPTLSLS